MDFRTEKAISEAGALSVIITGGHGDLGQALLSEFSQYPHLWSPHAPGRADLNVNDETGIQNYFADKSPDVLIVNAGISRDVPLHRLDFEDLEATFATNLRGAFLCAQAVVPKMLERGSGHIILIGSRTARSGAAGQTTYSSSKAALHGLSMSIAKEYGTGNIRCNVVLPGFLETKMTSNVTEKRRAEIRAEVALNRFNTPANAARFIAFLAGLDHVSGQVFTLDSRLDHWA